MGHAEVQTYYWAPVAMLKKVEAQADVQLMLASAYLAVDGHEDTQKLPFLYKLHVEEQLKLEVPEMAVWKTQFPEGPLPFVSQKAWLALVRFW